jgi:4-aminobutyrate aminotransferase
VKKKKRVLVRTPLPGPKSRKLIARDERYVSPSYTRVHPAVIERGEGPYLYDVDGNCFIDFHSGVGVCGTGNCHPRVVEAVVAQARRAIHIASADFYHEMVGKLAQKLSEIVPGRGAKRTFFTNSGTEAVECAIKLARYHTRRPRFIAFFNGFHGRSLGALSLTCSKLAQRRYFAPMLPEVTHVPYAYCYRCPINLKYPGCEIACLDWIEENILGKVAPAEEVAAIVAEPIQGEGGYVIPPEGYFQKLRKLCDKYGILLIMDEIQSGMGKTGKMFAIEHWGVVPDIVTTAKALASGVPLGACTASQKLMSWEPGAHSTTFGGSPLGCVAAMETIDLVQNGLMQNAEKVGKFIMRRLKKLQRQSKIIGDVRGKGLMIGIELVKSKKTREPAPELAEKVMQGCFRQGLMLLTCGACTVRFVPPLVIDEEVASRALDIFEMVVKKLERGGGR